MGWKASNEIQRENITYDNSSNNNDDWSSAQLAVAGTKPRIKSNQEQNPLKQDNSRQRAHRNEDDICIDKQIHGINIRAVKNKKKFTTHFIVFKQINILWNCGVWPRAIRAEDQDKEEEKWLKMTNK